MYFKLQPEHVEHRKRIMWNSLCLHFWSGCNRLECGFLTSWACSIQAMLLFTLYIVWKATLPKWCTGLNLLSNLGFCQNQLHLILMWKQLFWKLSCWLTEWWPGSILAVSSATQRGECLLAIPLPLTWCQVCAVCCQKRNCTYQSTTPEILKIFWKCLTLSE